MKRDLLKKEVNFQSQSNIEETERETQKWLNLSGERTGGSKLLADEISGGDVRNTEKTRESAGVSPLSDTGTTEEHPLHVSLLGNVSASSKKRRRGGHVASFG